MSADADHTVTFRLVTAPTTFALARIVATLRARNVRIHRLAWSTTDSAEGPGPGRATVTIDITPGPTGPRHLGRVLHRLIDVTTVETHIHPGRNNQPETLSAATVADRLGPSR